MLGKFISVREPNIKYLGLENMVRLAEVPAVADTINRCAVTPKPCTKRHVHQTCTKTYTRLRFVMLHRVGAPLRRLCLSL